VLFALAGGGRHHFAAASYMRCVPLQVPTDAAGADLSVGRQDRHQPPAGNMTRVLPAAADPDPTPEDLGSGELSAGWLRSISLTARLAFF
jgi:hypothetical protein